MSSDETQSALSRAYELVEAGKYDEARAILDPILAANPNNADAWWVYAHAVTNAEDGQAAIRNVLRINPNYPGAAALLAQASDAAPSPADLSKPKISKLSTQTGTMPAAPTHLPEANFPDLEEESAAFSTQERQAVTPRSRGGLPLIPILAVIVIFILVALFLLAQGNGGNNAAATPIPTLAIVEVATPTALPVEAATAEAAATTEPTVTALLAVESTLSSPAATEVVTAEASAEAAAENYSAIESSLAGFPLAESGVGEVTTSLGATLQATICTTGGRAMRTLLPQVMDELAKLSPLLDSSVEAIGVRMSDCTTNSTLSRVAVDVATARRYATGDLSDSAFAATWKPQ